MDTDSAAPWCGNKPQFGEPVTGAIEPTTAMDETPEMRNKVLSKPRADFAYRSQFEPLSQRPLGYRILGALILWLVLISLVHHWVNEKGGGRTTITSKQQQAGVKRGVPGAECASRITDGCAARTNQ